MADAVTVVFGRNGAEPTGITTVRAPELVLEGVLLSPDCGILYEIKHTIGVQCVLSSPCLPLSAERDDRTKRLYGKITTCMLLFSCA